MSVSRLVANHFAANVAETAALIQAGCDVPPRAGIILGTGLGSLADEMEVIAEWPYSALPHFAQSTADGHRGRLLYGRLNGTPTVMLDGRFHRYEGYSFAEVTFPVRVFSALGLSLLIVSNASGGLNPSFASGDIVLIDDHVDLMWSSPPERTLSPTGDVARGSLFETLYAPHRLALAQQAAQSEQIPLRQGTYVAVLGPNYETRAEYRWLRTIGDVVGMSTVPELLVAAESGLPTLAFSVVANVFRPESSVEKTTSEEVQAAVATAAPKLCQIVKRILVER